MYITVLQIIVYILTRLVMYFTGRPPKYGKLDVKTSPHGSPTSPDSAISTGSSCSSEHDSSVKKDILQRFESKDSPTRFPFPKTTIAPSPTKLRIPVVTPISVPSSSSSLPSVITATAAVAVANAVVSGSMHSTSPTVKKEPTQPSPINSPIMPKFTPIVTIATTSLPMTSVGNFVGACSISKVISTPPPLTAIVNSPSNLVIRAPEDLSLTSRPSSSSQMFQALDGGVVDKVKRVGHLKKRSDFFDEEDMETSSSDGDEFRDDDELFMSDPGK